MVVEISEKLNHYGDEYWIVKKEKEDKIDKDLYISCNTALTHMVNFLKDNNLVNKPMSPVLPNNEYFLKYDTYVLGNSGQVITRNQIPTVDELLRLLSMYYVLTPFNKGKMLLTDITDTVTYDRVMLVKDLLSETYNLEKIASDITTHLLKSHLVQMNNDKWYIDHCPLNLTDDIYLEHPDYLCSVLMDEFLLETIGPNILNFNAKESISYIESCLFKDINICALDKTYDRNLSIEVKYEGNGLIKIEYYVPYSSLRMKVITEHGVKEKR